MSSANEHLLPPPKPKLSPLEFRNTDLVSRLLAATPPYLYNMSLLPNTYFFSEMLRSLVQAKNEQARGHHQLHPAATRRSRKRTWSRVETMASGNVEAKQEQSQQQHHHEPWMIRSSKKAEENPLELTTKSEGGDEKTPFAAKTEQIYPPQDAASNLVLPPPPPMWYPPIYPHAPPYGIDPLHFFIDLRVSGHIYDRKNQKESSPTSTVVSPKNEEQKNEAGDIFGKQRRHCSAFSVPQPNKPVTLIENKKFDVKSMGFDKNTNKTGVNYVMGNISSIYKNLDEKKNEPTDEGSSTENRGEEKKKVRDLKALIGLELVVDYMNKKPGEEILESNESSEVDSVGSPALEVVDYQEDTD